MKNIYRWLFYGLLVLMALGIFGVGVYSALTEELTYTIEIVPGLIDMSFYSDVATTQEITGFQIAIVPRGSTVTSTFWVKNTGQETLSSIMATLIPSVVTWGTVSISPASVGTLTSGQSSQMTFTAVVSPSAALGIYSTGRIAFNAVTP